LNWTSTGCSTAGMKKHRPEAMRAAELEQLARSFFSQPGRSRLHYDLHTAIRGSKIEQFALYPWKEGASIHATNWRA